MTAKELFAKNLRFLRNQTNATCSNVAMLLDIDRQRYSAWEYGIATPDYNMLVQISDLYDIGIDNLLTCDLEAAA